MIPTMEILEDPIVFELTTTLREWHHIWLTLYLDNQTELFEKVGNLLPKLIDKRLELVDLLKQNSNHQDATAGREQHILELKSEIVQDLDLGNRLLGLDLVPRDSNFKPVDPILLSPIRLYQLHVEAAAASTILIPPNNCGNQTDSATITGSTLSSLSQVSSDSDSARNNNVGHNTSNHSYHLQLSLKGHQLACLPPDEVLELYFTIVDTSNNNNSIQNQYRPITEKYLVQILNDQIVCGVPNTIFTNLGPLSNRDVSIYIQAYRVGKMLIADGHKTAFSKQQSNLALPNGDGSRDSLSGSGRLPGNGLSRSRHSTIGHFTEAPKYKRPFGTAIISLKDHIKNSNLFKDTSISTKLFASNESEFSLPADISIKRNLTLKGGQTLANIQLDMSVKFLSGPQESLKKLVPDIPYCLTEKRGFPDVVMPGDFKNDLYFTLENGEFEKGGKSIPKNIEASISLIDKNGIVINECISPGSNCDNISFYRSCIFYHSNSPKWNDSIKINVPLAEFDNAHIRIEFRHCSTKEKEKKFIGFCFLPLSDEDGTVIADNSHELYLYKCDPQVWQDESLNLTKYTKLPFGPSAKVQSNARLSQQQHFTHSSREMVTVRTFLLSTKLTQNSNLLNLLKWRELVKRNKRDFEDALKKALELKGEEIVKFLQDILDTLFDTFSLYSTKEDNYSALIFKVLIHIFLLLDEPKYQNFRPVLDTYATAHFSATLVYKGLLACIKECLECSHIVERHAPIQKCFKSIKYVIQFIVQSKLLYSKATGEQSDEAFLSDLRQLFRMFEKLLSCSDKKLEPLQITLLESFPGTLGQLMKVLGPKELASVVTLLAGSIGVKLTPGLYRAKLIFMRETLSGDLPKIPDVRTRITENFTSHLEYYIKYSIELELCHEVLELLIVKVHDTHWPAVHRFYMQLTKSNSREPTPSTPMIPSPPVMTVGEINKCDKLTPIQANQLDLALNNLTRDLDPFIHLMDPLIQLLDCLFKDFNTEEILCQKYCACLLTIFKLMCQISFDKIVRTFDYGKLCDLFAAFREAYHREWLVMQLTTASILEDPIDKITQSIRARDDPSYQLNRQLNSYIKLITTFITHPTLQLEVFSESKRRYVLEVFGDPRLKYANQITGFWSSIERSSICDIIPATISELLDASLLSNVELQQKLIPLFWDMIDAENHFKLNTRQIESCIVDNLDTFLNLGRGDSNFIDNFQSILVKLTKEKNPAWRTQGLKLINSLIRLMKLLIEYRQSFENFENRSKQMCCLVDVLNYYGEQKDKNRDRDKDGDIYLQNYLRYLSKLIDMHLEVGNHTEAAFTLKLYTDEIRWSNSLLKQLDGYRPAELEWRRKEALYEEIIHNFDLGKCWEEALPMCKELASYYENILVDYEKYSATLKRLAQFLDNILTQHRPEREYFRVEFLGQDLPSYIKGKELIYRGGEYERLAVFVQRMTSEYPDVQLVHNKTKQSVSKDSPGQFMVISNVKPVPIVQDHLKTKNISDKVISYYLNNRLHTFSYDVPIMKGDASSNSNSGKDLKSVGPDNVNVKNLWVGRYVLKLKKELPNILPWSEVVSQEYFEISPINHAIETIESMNVELSKLILSYHEEHRKQISPLTMRLQGVIEAAVNGGPAVFVNAFLKNNAPNSTSNKQAPSGAANEIPSDPKLTARLRELIKKQYNILETGLVIHSKLAPPEVMPLHALLVDRLQAARKTLFDDVNLASVENNYEMIMTDNRDNQQQQQPLHLMTNPSQNSNHYVVSPALSPALRHHQHTALNLNGNSSTTTKDEVDGHDMNGNLFKGDQELDQIYSQPIEPPSHIDRRLWNGSKSELSSPSKHSNYNNHHHRNLNHHQQYSHNHNHRLLHPTSHNQHHSIYSTALSSQYSSVTSGSSSLSALAVLNNLPVHRSRLSLTPTRDPRSPHHHNHHQHASRHLPTSDLCAKASRKLTYDSTTTAGRLSSIGLSQSPIPNSRSANESPCNNNDDIAPPLPPRSFIVSGGNLATGGHATTRTLNRSPFMGQPAASSPMMSTSSNPVPLDGRWATPKEISNGSTGKTTHSPVINLGSLSTSEAERVLRSIDSDDQPLPSLPTKAGGGLINAPAPSNLPRLMVAIKSKQQNSSLVNSNDQVVAVAATSPPPLPSRSARSGTNLSQPATTISPSVVVPSSGANVALLCDSGEKLAASPDRQAGVVRENRQPMRQPPTTQVSEATVRDRRRSVDLNELATKIISDLDVNPVDDESSLLLVSPLEVSDAATSSSIMVECGDEVEPVSEEHDDKQEEYINGLDSPGSTDLMASTISDALASDEIQTFEVVSGEEEGVIIATTTTATVAYKQQEQE